METLPHHDLLAEILAFCGVKAMSKSEFGRLALNDPRFVYDIEAGRRECLPRTISKVRTFIADNAAKGAA